MFTLKFNTLNAAFEPSPVTEAVRILRDLANELEAGRWTDGGRLYDSSGNPIGRFTFTKDN